MTGKFEVTGKTKVLGIIGWPVEHSLSPLMQNAALTAANLDYIYVPFPISPDHLPDAVSGMRAMGVRGFNVTIPHKTAILPLLDEVSEEAAMVGAVNTVSNEGGRLVGYNTDSAGFIRSLRADLSVDPNGKKVVVLGAGGAARAAAHGLCKNGAASVVIVNRTVTRAAELVASLAPVFRSVSLAAESTDIFSSGDLRTTDLLVNTTSVGMGGTAFSDLDLARLSPGTAVYDMVYAPPVTPLLAAAGARGLPCANGLGMLAAQGEEAFEIWTGTAAPNGLMKERLLRFLEMQ